MKRIRYTLTVGLLIIVSIVKAQPVDSLSIKIGQMILIGLPSTTVDPLVLNEIKAGKVGSIIFFEKNIPLTNSYIELKKVIWTYQKAAKIPLFVCIDQEGGRVNRLKSKYGFPNSITAFDMANGGMDSVLLYSEATAATLAGLGFNVNFAPVVDLANNPTNPIIAKFGRAFSNSEDTVIRYASAVVDIHRKYNVVTSLKHFPGHGSSKDDTHLGLADVTNTWEKRELVPYEKMIKQKHVDAVMTSHIVNKNLDQEGNPGTLSSSIIQGILRDRFHFNGVVFTDDMQMHAITKHYGLEDAVKKAILAGVDIMTFSNNIVGSDVRTVDKVHDVIRDFVKRGEISEARIDESYRRIMALKKAFLIDDASTQMAEARAQEEKILLLEKSVQKLKEENKKLMATQNDAAKVEVKKKKKKK
jgi:beta-N-acetylhexosaminidase